MRLLPGNTPPATEDATDTRPAASDAPVVPLALAWAVRVALARLQRQLAGPELRRGPELPELPRLPIEPD